MADIRVVVYDDNEDLRETLCGLFRYSEGFEVCGSYSECTGVYRQVRELKPDVILMDIDMPVMTGIEGVRLAKEAKPEVNVIMLTVFDDNDHLFNALCAGANGYLLKQTPPARILEACMEIYSGGAPMNAAIARRVLDFLPRMRPAEKSYNLTAREKDILGLLVRGYSYKMVAGDCAISIDTVRSHIRNIYDKLQVSSATEAVGKAIRERLILNR